MPVSGGKRLPPPSNLCLNSVALFQCDTASGKQIERCGSYDAAGELSGLRYRYGRGPQPELVYLVGPGEAREWARQAIRGAPFPSWRPVPQDWVPFEVVRLTERSPKTMESPAVCIPNKTAAGTGVA